MARLLIALFAAAAATATAATGRTSGASLERCQGGHRHRPLQRNPSRHGCEARQTLRTSVSQIGSEGPKRGVFTQAGHSNP